MGIAALVLGIVSLVIGFIPFIGSIAFITAIVGLVLGIVDTVKKSKSGEKKDMSIAGIALSGSAMAVIILTWVFTLLMIAHGDFYRATSFFDPDYFYNYYYDDDYYDDEYYDEEDYYEDDYEEEREQPIKIESAL